MGSDITYDYLWKTYVEEKKTNKLLPLTKDFYKNAQEFISAFRSNEYDERTKNIKINTVKILKELYERRKQKILIYVAYGRQLPPQTPENEKDFYEKICNMAKSNTENNLQNQEAKDQLRSLKDIPEIILPSGDKIGPLSKNQELSISNGEDKSFLINSEICEKI